MVKKITTDELKKRIIEKHGTKYDLSKVEYKGYDENVCLICHEKDEYGNEHGEFWQTPSNLLHKTHPKGCQKCSNRKKYSNDIDYFIYRARMKFGDKFDYSKVDLEHKDEKGRICIICPIHGEFWQTQHNHLHSKHGCSKCYGNVRKSVEEFISDARRVHGDKYDYSKSIYVDNETPLTIICPTHGEFEQSPVKHVNSKHGCPYCLESHLEEEIRNFLIQNDIDFIVQCNNNTFKWLELQSLDFYLPKYNAAIECQGKQHFGLGGWREQYEKILERDKKKLEKCKENNVKLLYYSNLNIEYPYEVITDKNNLLNIIKSYEK